MSNGNKMQALVVKNEGYSCAKNPEGIQFDSMEPWLEFTQIDRPVLKKGQVLIKLILANINPSDLHFLKGEYGQPRVLGAVAGFEGIGEIVDHDAGEMGKALLGKRVAFIVSPDGSGSWADYATTDAHLCVPLLDDLADKDGAGLIVNPITALAMFDLVKQAKTKSFVLTAAGSQLGKLLIALGNEAGIDPIGIVRKSDYIEPLKTLGAKEVLSTDHQDFKNKFYQISKEYKPRIILDAVADQISSDLFMNMPNQSKWIIYGKLSPQDVRMDGLGQLIFSGKKIEGFWLTPWLFNLSFDEKNKIFLDAQNRFIDGRWNTPIRSTIKLNQAMDQLPKALSALNTGKIMLMR